MPSTVQAELTMLLAIHQKEGVETVALAANYIKYKIEFTSDVIEFNGN